MLALRKFCARRGLPSIIYSDNAKTFQATKGHLQKLYGANCPEWRFIVPRAPWWGGWWERLVRSVKSALRKSIGLKNLAQKELETVLIEVEACVNSRPLTAIQDSPDDQSPLTPASFLIGRGCFYDRQGVIEDVKAIESSADLVKRKVVHDSVVQRFWNIWSKDYLRNLPPCNNEGKGTVISEGDVVLIREDHIPRLTWPLGIVTKVFPGRDGRIRSCRVRTGGSEYERPIRRLHRLEVRSDVELRSEAAITDNYVRQSRFGRSIRPVNRF